MALEDFFLIPQRVITAIFGFLAIVNAYTMRVCLAMAITVIVVPREHTPDKEGTVCKPYGEKLLDARANKQSDLYDWSEDLQGFILGSFYIGYLISHIPGGLLADKFGGKWTLGLGILSTAFFSLATPYAIRTGGSTALIALRICTGLGEGTTFPALSALLSKWVPPSERGKLGAVVLGGGQVGTMVCNTASGFLIHHFGWESVFYVFGGVAILWFILFTILCYSDPRSHPFISQRELEYLAKEMHHGTDQEAPHYPTPWAAIATNVPMYALISAQIGHDWGFYIMSSDLPKYMSQVMSFSIKDNGVLSSLPSLVMWIVSVTSGFVADWLIAKNFMDTTGVRKLMTGIAAFPPAFCLVGASYAGCNHILVVLMFSLCLGFMGTYYGGMKLSPLDMSPNHAGTLMAITNGIGSMAGLVAPWTAGVMTPNAYLNEWRMVFWLAFVILNVTGIIYCIWASGEIQPYNDPETLKAYQEEKRARKQRAN